MRLILLTFLLSSFFLTNALAKELCDLDSFSDGDNWPISEETITKQNALEATKKLKQLISESENKEIFFAKKYGNTLECEIENSTNLIKLYSLKVDALKANGTKYQKQAISRFCNSLKDLKLCH